MPEFEITADKKGKFHISSKPVPGENTEDIQRAIVAQVNVAADLDIYNEIPTFLTHKRETVYAKVMDRLTHYADLETAEAFAQRYLNKEVGTKFISQKDGDIYKVTNKNF